MSVPINPGTNPIGGTATPLFEFRTGGFIPLTNTFSYAVTADGQRFLVSSIGDAEPTLDVLVNWRANVLFRK
jgi:hypothetical protein